MAIGYAAVKHQVETDVLGHVQAMEPIMEEEMAKLVAKHKCIKEGRVHGLAGGFDVCDKHGRFINQTHEAPQPIIRQTMFEEGLISIVKGHHVHCCPPLII